MYYIDQVLSPYAHFYSSVWQQECTLDQPVLLSPADGAVECPSGSITPGMTGVTVEWEAVTNADYYVLQISLHDQFLGPGFKSFIIAAPTTSYEFSQDDIRYSESIHWRIWAYTNAGCTSTKSESWSLTYNCDLPAGGGSGGGGSGDQGHSASFGDNLCERYAVKVDIEGPERLFCCDLDDYFGRIAYNCKDGVGNDLITLNNTDWEIEVEPGGSGLVTVTPFFDKATVQVSCHVSQKIKLTYIGEFTEIATAQTFECKATKRITINCDMSPKDKPWLQPSPYMPSTQVVVNNFDVILECDTFDPKNLNIFSDVFIEESTGFNSAAYNTDCCRPSFSSTTYYNIKLGTAGCVPLGCGLKTGEDGDLNTLIFDQAEILGGGGFFTEAPDYCGSNLYLGCGLKFGDPVADWIFGTTAPVEVDAYALAGPGLKLYREGDCKLTIDYGCGLYIDNEDKLRVDIGEIFSEGFEVNLSQSQCAVSLYLGCGLRFGQPWDVPGEKINPRVPVGLDLDEIAGLNLYVKGCALHSLGDFYGTTYNTFYYSSFPYDMGCGLGSDGTQIFVEPTDLFDWGFTPNGTCGVNVYVDDCTLELGDIGNVSGWGDVRPIQIKDSIAGKGLYWKDCVLHSDAEGEFPYGIGCGLEADAATISFDAWDVAGHGIYPTDSANTNCQLQALLGCGLKFDRNDPMEFSNDIGQSKFLYPIRLDVEAIAGNGLEATIGSDPPVCLLEVAAGYCMRVDEDGVSLNLGAGNSIPTTWLPVVAVQIDGQPCPSFYVNLDGLCDVGAGEWGLLAINENGEPDCIVATYCEYCP